MFYIHPDGCVDCDACVGACPAGAIYDELELPEHLVVWREINAEQSRQLPEVVLELA
jgi:ferredoxin